MLARSPGTLANPMRIPLTPHGTRELILFGGAFVLAAIALWQWHPAAAIVPAALFLFVLSFFRDPERPLPGGSEVAVAPADGLVVDIDEVDEPHFIGGKALRVGIYLSVFNVHVNRAPLDGAITGVRYTEGAFHDVRKPECITDNEANLVGFSGPRGVFAVRQIAGLVARRIIFPFQDGAHVTRGQRMGMIKFGSRTELFVPANAGVEVLVTLGQKVKGAATPMLRYPS